jgi:hypothetical protein
MLSVVFGKMGMTEHFFQLCVVVGKVGMTENFLSALCHIWENGYYYDGGSFYRLCVVFENMGLTGYFY